MKNPLLKRVYCFALMACTALLAPTLVNGAAVDVSAVENIRPARPSIPDRTFLLTDFGAVGDGKTLNTDAFKKAIAAIAQAGGGKLVVPKGIFRTLPITLCSNLDLHLAEER
ncbi:MAG: hypothetical protein IPP19_08830 [Verrucomicrobia bacterium]|nr:hypothetical protein [Verrucomicrobiota bacterium]